METFTDYLKAVEETLDRLNDATSLQWHHEWTGGNCDAFMHYTNPDNSAYFMVTVDASAPTTEEEWQDITLGYYTPDNDGGIIIDAVNNWDSLVDYFTDGNPYAHLHDLPYEEVK